MTTQPTQPEAARLLDAAERISKLEGAVEQANLRFGDTIETFAVLRAENRDEHQEMRNEYRLGHQTLEAKIEAQRAENRGEHQEMRNEYRLGHQTLEAKIEAQRAENRDEHQEMRNEYRTGHERLESKIEAYRAENREEHRALEAKIDAVRAENQVLFAKLEEQGKRIEELRADMYRHTLWVGGGVVGLLGGLMTLFQFLG